MDTDDLLCRLDAFRELRAELPGIMHTLRGRDVPISEIARRSGYTDPGVRRLIDRPVPADETVTAYTDEATVKGILADLFPGEDHTLESSSRFEYRADVRPRFSRFKHCSVTLPPGKAQRFVTALMAKGVRIS